MYRRGRAPSIVQICIDESSPATASPATHRDEISAQAGSRYVDPVPSSRNSEEREVAGVDGQYIGPSSGLTFLVRAQKRLRETASLRREASIFTFGDAPLPNFDTSFFEIPLHAEAVSLMKTYFDFAFPTHRFLHRPTVEGWLDDFYNRRKQVNVPPGTRERNSLVLIMLAHAKLYSKNDSEDDMDGVSRSVDVTHHRSVS